MAGQAPSERLVTPRGRFPHARVAGELIYVSGTSSRRPDNTIAGAAVDELGTTTLDIRVQTRAVLDNIRAILQRLRRRPVRSGPGHHLPGVDERLRRLQRGMGRVLPRIPLPPAPPLRCTSFRTRIC